MKLGYSVLCVGVICLLCAPSALVAAGSAASGPSAEISAATRPSHIVAPGAAPARAAFLLAQRVAAAGAPAAATETAGPARELPLKIGVVDIQTVRDGWGVVEELQKQKDYVTQDVPRIMAAEYGYRQTLLFFTEDEAEEAVALWRKAVRDRNATPEERKRLEALDNEAKDRAVKFQALVQKETLTDDEKRELGFLREIRTGRQAQLEQLQGAYQQEMGRLQQQYEDVDRQALDELRKATQRVAEKQQLDLVFTREAVLYGGIDISQDVIQDLQANVPTLARPAAPAEGAAGP